MRKTLIMLALAGAWLLVEVPVLHALTFTCSTVARRGAGDPLGAVLKNRYDSPAINGLGDVAFVGYPAAAPRRLYLYPAAGTPSVVAQQGGAAPGGSAFKKFRAVSIDDAGDVAFQATLSAGEGVFSGPPGSLAKAAMTGDASPAGGAFKAFPSVSRVNTVGEVAFSARVDGGPSGVFVYAASAAAVATVALVDDATVDGRRLCDILDVGLGASGAVAVRAATKVDCASVAESDLRGVYVTTPGGLARVALEGDPAPTAGTTFTRFIGPPDVNAAGKVLFRAGTGGVASGEGLFLHDPTGATTLRLAGTGDAAPATTGSLKTIAPAGVTDDDRVAFGARIANGLAKIGIFLFDASATNEKVVASNDDPPTDAFGPNSSYLKINPGNRKTNEGIGADRSGTRIAYTAKVKDTLGTPTASGVFRCAGS